MQVRDMMTRTVVTATSDMSLIEVARLMVEHRVSAIPVIDNGVVAGIVSEADLLHRYELGTARDATARPWWRRLLVGEGAAWDDVESHATQVRDIMSAPVATVEERTSAAELAALFESRRIRRAPVLRNGAIVGIVSRAAFVRALVSQAEIRRDERPRSDERIRNSLLHELASQRWWRPERCDISVDDGVVHISGWMDSSPDRAALRIAAENVHGVQTVEDERLQSEPPGSYL